MSIEDPQKVWTAYYERKKAERLEQASALWQQMRLSGVKGDTLLALDFVHFGTSRSDVEALATQLRENYDMYVVPSEEPGYWLAKGTTRPIGIALDREQHLSWVEFMSDVAQSYACVFSSWSFDAPSLSVSFSSERYASAT